MKLILTGKFQKLLKSRISVENEKIEERSIWNWNCNYFSIDRKKYLAFTNNKTLYSIFIRDFRNANTSRLSQIFATRLLEQLHFDQIQVPESFIKQLANKCQEARFFKTNNDKITIGVLNRATSDLICHREVKYYSEEEMNLALENHYINEMATGKLHSTKKSSYSKPKEEFAKEIMANA